MLRCTFFRNFCVFANPAFITTNAWPLVANMGANAFIHNDAIAIVGDEFFFDPPVRTKRVRTDDSQMQLT